MMRSNESQGFGNAFAILIVAAIFMVTLVACGKGDSEKVSNPTENTLEKVTDTADKLTDKTKEMTQGAIDAAGDAVDKATDTAKDAYDAAGNMVKETTD